MDFDGKTAKKRMPRSDTGYTDSPGLLRLVPTTLFLYLLLGCRLKVIKFYSCLMLSFSGMGDGGYTEFDQ